MADPVDVTGPAFLRFRSSATADSDGESIVVSSSRVTNLRLSLLQLRLSEFHDRCQAKAVAGLSEAEGQISLLKKLLRNGERAVGTLGA